METYTCPLEIMKRGAQSLQMKMRNAELNLKGSAELQLFTACSHMQQDCSIQRKSYKDSETVPNGSTPNTEGNIGASFALSTRRFTSLR